MDKLQSIWQQNLKKKPCVFHHYELLLLLFLLYLFHWIPDFAKLLHQGHPTVPQTGKSNNIKKSNSSTSSTRWEVGTKSHHLGNNSANKINFPEDNPPGSTSAVIGTKCSAEGGSTWSIGSAESCGLSYPASGTSCTLTRMGKLASGPSRLRGRVLLVLWWSENRVK